MCSHLCNTFTSPSVESIILHTRDSWKMLTGAALVVLVMISMWPMFDVCLFCFFMEGCSPWPYHAGGKQGWPPRLRFCRGATVCLRVLWRKAGHGKHEGGLNWKGLWGCNDFGVNALPLLSTFARESLSRTSSLFDEALSPSCMQSSQHPPLECDRFPLKGKHSHAQFLHWASLQWGARIILPHPPPSNPAPGILL